MLPGGGDGLLRIAAAVPDGVGDCTYNEQPNQCPEAATLLCSDGIALLPGFGVAQRSPLMIAYLASLFCLLSFLSAPGVLRLKSSGLPLRFPEVLPVLLTLLFRTPFCGLCTDVIGAIPGACSIRLALRKLLIVRH
jgi:hypothetical protein